MKSSSSIAVLILGMITCTNVIAQTEDAENGSPLLREIAASIREAKTVSSTVTPYFKGTDEETGEAWLRAGAASTLDARVPDLYRDTRYAPDGTELLIQIIDTKKGKTLHLDMKNSTATWRDQSINVYGGDVLEFYAKLVESMPPKRVGQTTVDGVELDVYRKPSKNGRSLDVWIDTANKKLVGISIPGGDVLDLSKIQDNSNAKGGAIRGRPVGQVRGNLKFDEKFDDGWFSQVIPDGFEVAKAEPSLNPRTPRTPIEKIELNEKAIVDFFRESAKVNDNAYYQNARGIPNEKLRVMIQSPPSDQSEAEARFAKLYLSHMRARNLPIARKFAIKFAEAGTFKYVGSGVKLGDAESLVFWYKSKESGMWRAMFGDATIRDVSEDDLPKTQ